ncbi:MAG: hypothetical protein J6R01_02740 [Alistipes sp.]|jgi:hypothetical protein|nr:hypothetical protein [Alistipes sp.]MBO7307514.1 hypothetical protein [Alistipes sp.]
MNEPFVEMVELSAANMRIGVIIVRDFDDYAEKHLSPFVDSLTSMGCQPQNIVIRRIPTLHDVIIMLQFFAQYTDVDGVVVLAPENRVMGLLSLMNGIVHVQTHWNMVVSIGGAERAEDVVTMITIQNEMEAEAVDMTAKENFS